MRTHREIEVKLEVPPEATLPDLAVLPGVAAVDGPEVCTLEAVYLDTPDLRLARARTTLRRRAGGPDAGWHLKLPVSAHERTEHHMPLGSAAGTVPAELTTHIRARVREAPLAPVVVLHTHRTVRRLRDTAGRVLAEVADDAVTARSPDAGDIVVDAWREWEVELVEGDRALLTAALELLQAGGGVVPARTSKLARALGERLTDAVTGTDCEPVADGSAGAALRSHLRTLRDELLERDPQVRRDEADAVHQMRVATRQLRSALATFRSLQEGEHAEPVRIELGWLGGLLGVARDAEVARARLAELVAAEPAELVLGPVGQRLDADRARAYRAAHQRVLKALDSARYFRLLDGLDALVDAPLLTRAAIAPAADVLPNRVHRDFKRLARAVDAARSSPPGPRRDKRLHEARKAAKRTRYAAEAVIPTIGRPAERFAYAAKALQTLLGDHHDSVELRAVLRRVGAAAHRDGEDTFTYGRLHALEQAHAERIEDQLPKLWKQISASRLRAWMR